MRDASAVRCAVRSAWAPPLTCRTCIAARRSASAAHAHIARRRGSCISPPPLGAAGVGGARSVDGAPVSQPKRPNDFFSGSGCGLLRLCCGFSIARPSARGDPSSPPGVPICWRCATHCCICAVEASIDRRRACSARSCWKARSCPLRWKRATPDRSLRDASIVCATNAAHSRSARLRGSCGAAASIRRRTVAGVSGEVSPSGEPRLRARCGVLGGGSVLPSAASWLNHEKRFDCLSLTVVTDGGADLPAAAHGVAARPEGLTIGLSCTSQCCSLFDASVSRSRSAAMTSMRLNSLRCVTRP